MNRRGFLGSILAAAAAPAIVRADSLMRIVPREIAVVLPSPLQYGDVIRYEIAEEWQSDPLMPLRAQREIDARLDAIALQIGRRLGSREYLWFPRRFIESDPNVQRAIVAAKGYA